MENWRVNRNGGMRMVSSGIKNFAEMGTWRVNRKYGMRMVTDFTKAGVGRVDGVGMDGNG